MSGGGHEAAHGAHEGGAEKKRGIKAMIKHAGETASGGISAYVHNNVGTTVGESLHATVGQIPAEVTHDVKSFGLSVDPHEGVLEGTASVLEATRRGVKKVLGPVGDATIGLIPGVPARVLRSAAKIIGHGAGIPIVGKPIAWLAAKLGLIGTKSVNPHWKGVVEAAKKRDENGGGAAAHAADHPADHAAGH